MREAGIGGSSTMRELIGKLALNEPGVTRSVYRSELIRCGECQRMAPIGIEVITARRDGDSQKILEHRYFCRTHGLDYETRSQNPPRHSAPKSKSPDNDAYLRNFLKHR
jgi:hypothetical protein